MTILKFLWARALAIFTSIAYRQTIFSVSTSTCNVVVLSVYIFRGVQMYSGDVSAHARVSRCH